MKEISFHPYQNIIIGSNAIGKTSLVEAIYCLCFGKSFKSVKDSDLIQKEKLFYRIEATFIWDDNGDEVSLSYDNKNKKIEKNNKTYKTTSEYIGYFNIVVFSPDDLELVKGSPSVRRQFLDVHLGQMDKIYLKALIRFKRILKERNELLKGSKNNNNVVLLKVLTEALIEEASHIIRKRQSFIGSLNPHSYTQGNTISLGKECVKLVYKPHCIVENLKQVAKDSEDRDWGAQTTTWGPTRDDVSVQINDESAVLFGSQGQIRTACLAIKLGLAEMMRQANEKTIIILDDVFSELDKTRQKAILQLLNKQYQTFITTTSIDALIKDVLDDCKIIEIKEGE